MHIQLSPEEVRQLKSASAQADTWHFNKYILAIFGVLGILVGVGKAIHDVMMGVWEWQPFILPTILFSAGTVWLKKNWSKNDKERAIELICDKIKETGSATL